MGEGMTAVVRAQNYPGAPLLDETKTKQNNLNLTGEDNRNCHP